MGLGLLPLNEVKWLMSLLSAVNRSQKILASVPLGPSFNPFLICWLAYKSEFRIKATTMSKADFSSPLSVEVGDT